MVAALPAPSRGPAGKRRLPPKVIDGTAREVDAASPDGNGEDAVTLYVTWYEDSVQTSYTSRRLAERDRDYYDNKQLTTAEKAALAKRGQPDVIINRIQAKVNYLLGYEAAQRTDPRGYPRTPQDEDASEACTDALRYIRDKVTLSQIFSQAWENMLIEGVGAAEFGVEPSGEGDAEITGKAIHWDRLFWDPHAHEHDFADARYLGLVVWMDEVEARQRWPQSADAIARTVAVEQGNTYDDRPAWKTWSTHGNRKRVQIVQMYHKKGDVWQWCIFTKGGKLAGGEVPYRNQDNKSLCPLILQSAFVTRDNDRYGFVRALIGPQDEINKRRSKGLHLLMGKGAIMEDGAVDDEDATKVAMQAVTGLIKVNPGFRFDVIDNKQDMEGHLELLQESKQEIDLMGPNAAMQGKGERSASGRAIIANQQGGQIEIYRLTDRHNHFKHRSYELVWAMVQQYWTAEKWIRVTDDEKNVRFVGLNQPQLYAQQLVEKAVANGVDAQDAKAQLASQVMADPSGQVREALSRTVYKNSPAEMTMDIILEEVPDAANVQQEQFEIMAKLGQMIPFPPEMWIKMSALRNKRELLEEMEKAKEDPQAQADAQARQQMQALELHKGQAELKTMMAKLEELMRKSAKDAAEVDNTHADTEVKRATAVKTMAEADMVDAQIGQVQLPQVMGGPPWAQDLTGGMGGGMGTGGPGGFPMPPMSPSPTQSPQGPPLAGPPGLPPGVVPPPPPPGMMLGMPGLPPPPPGPLPGEQPMGPGPGYPPPPDPGAMPMPPPQFNPREFQAPPPGQGGY